jgi:hypothetical protein
MTWANAGLFVRVQQQVLHRAGGLQLFVYPQDRGIAKRHILKEGTSQ